jgi:hypothetical protein
MPQTYSIGWTGVRQQTIAWRMLRRYAGGTIDLVTAGPSPRIPLIFVLLKHCYFRSWKDYWSVTYSSYQLKTWCLKPFETGSINYLKTIARGDVQIEALLDGRSTTLAYIFLLWYHYDYLPLLSSQPTYPLLNWLPPWSLYQPEYLTYSISCPNLFSQESKW